MSNVKPLVVHGTDLSHHNRTPDLKLAKKNGLKWLYHKATEGTTYRDPDYPARRKLAKEAGVPFGAYHFASPDGKDAVAEARAFIAYADPQPGDLVPVLDFEVAFFNAKQWCLDFMAEVERLLAKRKLNGKPMHYGPDDFGSDYKYLRWVPRYNNDNIQPRVRWDIWQFSNGVYGKPNSFPGLGNVDLNFMRAGLKVEDFKLNSRVKDPKPKDTVKVKFAHCSMQFSDSPKQMKHDVEVIFGRGYDIITGTEAGPGADPLGDLLAEEAAEQGYHFFLPQRPTDCWVAVHDEMVDRGWTTAYEPVIPDSRALGASRNWGPKGVVSVRFINNELGEINVAAAHYLTGARKPGPSSVHGGVDHWAWNEKLARAVGRWAREHGSGKALAFYGGDQNMADNRNNEPQGDTFFGEPLTSSWDELKKWEGTGHGNIDVIASYDADGRVKAKSVHALNDKKLFLHTDHFLVEAVYEIKKLAQ